MVTLKQFIGLWSLFYLFNGAESSIDKDQDKFLKNIKCGIATRSLNTKVSSRIINSETIDYLYP